MTPATRSHPRLVAVAGTLPHNRLFGSDALRPSRGSGEGLIDRVEISCRGETIATATFQLRQDRVLSTIPCIYLTPCLEHKSKALVRPCRGQWRLADCIIVCDG